MLINDAKEERMVEAVIRIPWDQKTLKSRAHFKGIKSVVKTLLVLDSRPKSNKTLDSTLFCSSLFIQFIKSLSRLRLWLWNNNYTSKICKIKTFEVEWFCLFVCVEQSMEVGQMQRRLIDYTKSLFMEVTKVLNQTKCIIIYGLCFLFCIVLLVCYVWSEKGCFFVLICFQCVGCLALYLFGESRGSWMVSFCSFNNFKMKATQILLLKWSLFSLKMLRSFSMISPELCEYQSSLLSTLSHTNTHT